MNKLRCGYDKFSLECRDLEKNKFGIEYDKNDFMLHVEINLLLKFVDICYVFNEQKLNQKFLS